jgi:LmbE family N-acetylglucosaminyl deacetylase
MSNSLRLMTVFPHPDDETLGTGGLLAHSAAQGVEITCLVATRGERGWQGRPEDNPGLEALGRLREAETRAAASVLGVQEVVFLDYLDGEVDQAEPREVIAQIVREVRRVRPQVVVTFPPDGNYGHPDHIALSQFTGAALVCAAAADYAAGGLPAHCVLKFYYMVDSKPIVDFFVAKFGAIEMHIDGVKRTHVPWEAWAITTRVDVSAHWRTVWQAALCHASQTEGFREVVEKLSEDEQRRAWGEATFYRAYSLVNGGRKTETDLFEGLR